MKWNKIKRKSEGLLKGIGFKIDPSIKVGRLGVAQQQIVEIVKALSQKVKVLILDEPSAILGPYEIQKLFETLNQLKIEGVAIIYISHHLSEVFQIADRVSVLKDGMLSNSLLVDETEKDEIIKLMLGRSLDAMYPLRDSTVGEEVLKAKSLHYSDKVRDVSLSVKAGEILGLAGLVGSGRTETVRLIFGADKMERGAVFLNGKRINIKSPQKAVKMGIGMVPEDRKRQGVILPLSVKHNLSLSNFDQISDKMGFIKTRKERNYANELIRKLSIKTRDEDSAVEKLSGGNQQKVAFAKWISRHNKVLIIDEPTRGVDIGAKVEIYNLINDLAKEQIGVILISSETAELIGICDRIIVMRNGQVQGELQKKDFSEEDILRLSIGE